ncbi:hypothetical protein BHM03_00026228 [Ensete ventricosum]|nr:hypothetical protein BHM03_00026228 [Ensete ventricosum]
MAMASSLAGAAGHLQGATGCIQGPPEKGRPASAMPPTRGGHPQGQQPRGHDRLRPTRNGLPPAARPQGPLAPHGATARGSRPRPGHRWWLPVARLHGAAPRLGPPPARAVAGRSGRQQGQRCQPAQSSSDDGDANGGKERTKASI